MTKSEIRNMIRRLKSKRLSAASSLSICNKVLRHQKVIESSTVLLYNSLPDEVDTSQLLADLCTKRILLPCVVGDELELREYTGVTQTGAFGIDEPVGPIFSHYDSIDVAIVPGVAFTMDGKRLGRGRGYYDRLLPRLTHSYKIGICYDWQIVLDIPTQLHDVKVDEVIC